MRMAVLSVVVAFGLSTGCRTVETGDVNTDRPTGEHQVSEKPISLWDAIDLWRQGDREGAVRAYVAAAEGADEDHELLLFDLTEQEYSALSAAEREQRLSDFILLSREVRGLTREVLKVSEELSAAGDQATGAEYLDAAERVGRAHAESDLLFARSMGRAILVGVEAKRNMP